jgi:Tfp pilus assembly protein PilZ
MAWAQDFDGLALRDVVAINLGTRTEWTSLSGIVVALRADYQELELALPRPPDDPGLLAPGTFVRVRRDSGPSTRAQVIAVQAGRVHVVVVRALGNVISEQNSRAFHRVPITVQPVTLVVQSDGRTVGAQGWITDLSGGGARLTVPLKVERGDVVLLRFTLPDSTERLAVRAEVAWTESLRGEQQHQMGVRFVSVPDGLRDSIVRGVFQAEMALRQLSAPSHRAG